MPSETQVLLWMKKSPIYFIELVWKLSPQPFKDEKTKKMAMNTPLYDWKAEWFGEFKKGVHLTWQQYVVLVAVERGIRGEAKSRISVASAHGVGKSAILSMLILWFLFVFRNSNVGCTAPSSDQLHQALWKEVFLRHSMMPQHIADDYEITDDYARIKANPKVWWASARTARDDKPEALQGLHADDLLVVCDEASGIGNKVFEVMEGTMTGAKIMIILISNPTRLIGYFYDTHNEDKESWQQLHFSSIDSPIVDEKYVKRIAKKYGVDSDEYRVRVLGLFPRADAVDKKGYTPVFLDSDIRAIYDTNYNFLKPKMGIDPAGRGRDETTWVLRDRFRAKVIGREKTTNALEITEKTIGLMTLYNVKSDRVYIDSFGLGGDSVQLLERSEKQIKAINVGDPAEEKSVYKNKKAENYFRAKRWVREGGEFLGNASEWADLKFVRSQAKERDNRIGIKTKEEMRRDNEPSPNIAEALMLTFSDEDDFANVSPAVEQKFQNAVEQNFDRLAG